jgi:hypothetical protein
MSETVAEQLTTLLGILAAAMPVPARRFLLSVSAGRPTQQTLLKLVTERNSLLDRIFYNTEPQDVDRIVRAHATRSAMAQERGAIIVVYPDRDRDFDYFWDPVDFFAHSNESSEVIGVSVAGVGSSSIGAVALARDVASVANGPVAAVVAGYGVDDVVNEALGGWFFLRETNRLEFAIEQISNALSRVTALPELKTAINVMDSIGSGPDLVALKALIRDGRLGKLRWLVGHSKGNLLISSAISELVMDGVDLASLMADVRVVFFSALSALPGGVGQQHQIIGDMDALGWINSRINIPHTLVHGAMHHMNRSYPFHMNAPEQLARIIDEVSLRSHP